MDNVGIERTVVLGSPVYTFKLGTNGFTRHDDNNEVVLGLSQMEPDRIIPFVVIYPEDEDAPQKLRNFVARGAKGVKLFAGHGASHGHGPFHTMPLDDPRLTAVYEIIKEHNLPVLFHVNYAKYKDEFERVLCAPDDEGVVPSFLPDIERHAQVDSLLNRYPNLWMDVPSDGFSSKPKATDARCQARQGARCDQCASRFLYGTDLVLTDYENKDEEWITMNMFFIEMYWSVKPTRSMVKWGSVGRLNLQMLCNQDLPR